MLYDSQESLEVIAMLCPYCGSDTRQVKAGTNSGQQRYKCGNCQRRYTPQAQGRGYKDSVRAEVFRLHNEGMKIRPIARQLGINHQTAANWLRNMPRAFPQKEREVPLVGKRRPTIHDVAEHAGVSTASVSNFLNQKGRMSESTRQRIQQAMEQLRFTPSALVRAIQNRRTHILGVFLYGLSHLDETESPFSYLTPALLRGINDGADIAQNDLLLYTGKPRRLENETGVRFLDGHIDGLIWMTPDKNTPILEHIIAAGLPVVALMTREVPETVAYVNADNIGAMNLLIKHMAEMGNRHIAYIGPDWGSNFRDRHSGFHQAVNQAGLPWNPARQIIAGKSDFTPEGCLHILTRLFALYDAPTAILCGNDDMAAKMAEGLRVLGKRIPEDVALAGFDDTPIAEHVAGGLTTIRQPFRLLGQRAAESLLALVEGNPTSDYRLTLPVELIVRRSSLHAR